jgi:hypothetical protein
MGSSLLPVLIQNHAILSLDFESQLYIQPLGFVHCTNELFSLLWVVQINIYASTFYDAHTYAISNHNLGAYVLLRGFAWRGNMDLSSQLDVRKTYWDFVADMLGNSRRSECFQQQQRRFPSSNLFMGPPGWRQTMNTRQGELLELKGTYATPKTPRVFFLV